MSTSFQIASDLHIEYNNSDNPLDYFTPSAETLILAGDICSCNNFERFKNFIVKTCALFKRVIFVAGNHEYYKYRTHDNFFDMNEINNKLNLICKDVNNFYFLNKDKIEDENVCIIGCTLWSHIEFEIPRFIVKIKNINTSIYNKLHLEDLEYIKKMITYSKNKNKKLIIVTHYPPVKQYGHFKENCEYKELYFNTLEELLNKDQVSTWIFGHTHFNTCEITKGGTLLICNQKGKGKNILENYLENFTFSI